MYTLRITCDKVSVQQAKEKGTQQMQYVLIATKENGTLKEGQKALSALKAVLPKPKFPEPKFPDFGVSVGGNRDVVQYRNQVLIFADFTAAHVFAAKDKAARFLKKAGLTDFTYSVEGQI